MKKSLIVAATFAAISLGAANVASAAGIGFARGVITASTAGGGNLAP